MGEVFSIRREIVRLKDWYRASPSYVTQAQRAAVLHALNTLLGMTRAADKGDDWAKWRMGPDHG